MDWFQRPTGFCETAYSDTRAKLKVDGQQLQSLVNGKSYGIGELELVPLQTLRERVKSIGGLSGRSLVRSAGTAAAHGAYFLVNILNSDLLT
jgi:hypothetical protein